MSAMTSGRLEMARADLAAARRSFRDGNERAGWFSMVAALWWMKAVVRDTMARVPR